MTPVAKPRQCCGLGAPARHLAPGRKVGRSGLLGLLLLAWLGLPASAFGIIVSSPLADRTVTANPLLGDGVANFSIQIEIVSGNEYKVEWLVDGNLERTVGPGVLSPTQNFSVSRAPDEYLIEVVVTEFDSAGVVIAEDFDDAVLTVLEDTNTPPTADAGVDFSVFPGGSFTLDASASTDSESLPSELTYAWTYSSGAIPEADLTLSRLDSAEVTGQIPSAIDLSSTGVILPASLVFAVDVTDSNGTGLTDTDLVTVTVQPPPNQPPVADASVPSEAFPGDMVVLDGSLSSDPDDGVSDLSFDWTQTSGVPVSLMNATTAEASFTVPPEASFPSFPNPSLLEFTLTVEDPSGAVGSTTVELLVQPPPVTVPKVELVQVNPDPAAVGQQVIVLASFDGTLDGLDVDVTQTAGPNIGTPQVFQGTTDLQIIFDAPAPQGGTPGVGLEVKVSDPGGGSFEAFDVFVSIVDAAPPTANAGPDIVANPGDTVTLTGVAGPEGLTGIWDQQSGVPTEFDEESNPATVQIPSEAEIFEAGFDLPAVAIFEFFVFDSQTGLSAVDTVTITIVRDEETPAETDPFADAGPDRSAQVGGAVTLDGSGSQNAVAFQWGFLTRPAASSAALDDAGTPQAQLVPDVPGTYVVILTVTDGEGDTDSDTAVITVQAGEDPGNAPPVAVVQFDSETATVGDIVQLDATASSDPDGDPLSFSFAFEPPANSDATLSATDVATPSFIPDVPGTYVATVTVSDGQATDTATITLVAELGAVPIANAGGNQTRLVGTLAVLNGRNSQPGPGLPGELVYRWSILSAPQGSTAEIQDGDQEVARLRPDVSGTYIVELVVVQNGISSEPDTARITVVVSGVSAAQSNEARLLQSTDQACANLQATDPEAFTPEQTDLSIVCGALAGSDENQRRNYAEATIADDVVAQNDQSRDVASAQENNVQQRLQQIRTGGAGAGGGAGALAGLRINLNGEQLPGHLLAALADELGGGGSNGEGGAAGQQPFGSRWGVFVNGNLNFGKRDGSGQEEGYEFDTSGVTAGVDYRLGDAFVIGGALGWATTDIDFDTQGSQLDLESYSFNLYGTYYRESFYLDTIVTYGVSDLDTDRAVRYQLAGLERNAIASGSTDGDQLLIGVSAGYSFARAGLTLAPEASITYVATTVDGYNESGAGADSLIYEDQEGEFLTLKFGGRANYAISTGIGVFLPQVRTNFVQELQDDAREITLRRVSAPDEAFGLVTDEADDQYFEFGVGVTGVFPRGVSAFIDYQRVLGFQDLDSNDLSFGLRWEVDF